MTCFDSKFADNVAKLCYDKFENLPKSGKPILQKEWTLVSCIVMHNENNMQVVSLATGSKCIGHNKMTNDGTVLNDSHAEVLARRGFLRYVYHQIKLSRLDQNSIFQYDLESKKYKLMRDITFHLFTSQVPCGDAAIFPKLLHTSIANCSTVAEDDVEPTTKKRKMTEGMKEEPEEEESRGRSVEKKLNDINRTGAKCLPVGIQDNKLPGIGYHVTGIVRTKPGRGERTLSVSCSDKIAKWNCLGIQGALLSLVIEEIYLTSIIVGCPHQRYSYAALKRAVIDRVSPFIKRAPLLLHSDLVFIFRKNDIMKPSPNSIVWSNVDSRNHEVAVDGKRLGCTKGKKGELSISRKCLLKLFHEISDDKYENHSYGYIKQQSIEYGKNWEQVKKHLGNWSEKPKELSSFT